MTIRGFPDQKKTGSNNADGTPSASGGQQYATVNPVRQEQNALDVIAHFTHQVIGADAAEAASTTTVIVATGHAAKVGDAISWTSGALDTLEFRVKAVDTNAITVSEAMAVAPTAADTFNILRPKYLTVDDEGNLVVAVTFSNDTEYGVVGADTLRTASQIGNATGAADFDDGVIGAQTLRVGLASDQLSTLATEVTAAAILADTAAIQTAVEIIDNAISGNEMQVDVITLPALPAGTNNIGDVDVLSLPELPAGTNNIGDVDVLSLPELPAGANTIGSVGVTNLPTTVTLNAGAADASTLRAAIAATNLAYTASGKIAGASLTGSYATLLDPSSDLRILNLFNSCNATILISLDGGSTDSMELEVGESVSLDLAANGLKFANAVNISAKHAGAAPTAGTIRASGIG